MHFFNNSIFVILYRQAEQSLAVSIFVRSHSRLVIVLVFVFNFFDYCMW